MFGGIKVVDKEDMGQLTIEQVAKLNGSSFIYMSDLWKFELLSNQWVQVEVYGISEITRNLYLWNGTYVKMDIETKDRVAEDFNYTKFQQ